MAAFSVVVAIAFLTGPPFWWKYVNGSRNIPSGVTGFSGGCSAFQVFAQNRWRPIGTSERAAPDVTSRKVNGFAPNESIPVDGWVHARPAYPSNTAPWDSDVWFHVADNSGWVSFAGVRDLPVSFDPTGRSADGGVPAPTTAGCEGSAQ